MVSITAEFGNYANLPMFGQYNHQFSYALAFLITFFYPLGNVYGTLFIGSRSVE